MATAQHATVCGRSVGPALLGAVVGALASAANAGSIPVSGNVAGTGVTDIGTLDVAIQAGGGIHVDFEFAEGFGFLDEWYDFQWLNVEVGYTVDGVPQVTDPVVGTLPAIDPQQNDGPEPYYYNNDEWSSGMFNGIDIRDEGIGSKFVDFRNDPGVNSVITFHTYLVVTSVTDPAIGATDFCILGGIQWTYTSATDTAEWTGSLLAGAPNAAEINAAMANGNPPFVGWTPLTGCVLSACPYIFDCVLCGTSLVTFGPSLWTIGGTPLGETFPGGVTPHPGVPAYWPRYFPVEPNDWHWQVTYPCGPFEGTMTVDVVNFGPKDSIRVEALCSLAVGPAPLHLFVDYGNNFYMLSIQGGPVIWQGQWSQYPNDIPPSFQFQPTGNIRQNFNTPPTGLVINEVRVDEPGTDNNEYFELMGPPGMPLADLTYLVIGDFQASQASGVIEALIPINAPMMPPDGHFLVAEASFTLGPPDMTANLNFENDDNVTHMLVRGFSGTLNQDLDPNDDGTLDLQPWQQIIDVVGLSESPNPPVGTEFTYGPPTLGPDVGGFVPGQVYRCVPDGLWRIGKFDLAFATDTPGNPNLLCSPPPPPTGACCASDGTCFQASESTCAALRGAYQGNDTDCGAVECANPCPSDVNGDGVTNVDDLLAVINGSGQPGPSDVDGNGITNVDDLLMVINAWGPCP